jgi:hypothetical protein
MNEVNLQSQYQPCYKAPLDKYYIEDGHKLSYSLRRPWFGTSHFQWKQSVKKEVKEDIAYFYNLLAC